MCEKCGLTSRCLRRLTLIQAEKINKEAIQVEIDCAICARKIEILAVREAI